jgi:hypothetical protein
MDKKFARFLREKYVNSLIHSLKLPCFLSNRNNNVTQALILHKALIFYVKPLQHTLSSNLFEVRDE